MSCATCEATKRALQGRVESLEQFARTVAGAFGGAVLTAPTAQWRSTWPESPEHGPTRKGAWKAGFRTAMSGMPRTGCPYRGNSRGHDDSWRRGWDAGADYMLDHPDEK